LSWNEACQISVIITQNIHMEETMIRNVNSVC
jgi:hypothetical protein